MCYLLMAQGKKPTLLNIGLEGGESFLKLSIESLSLGIKELNLPMAQVKRPTSSNHKKRATTLRMILIYGIKGTQVSRSRKCSKFIACLFLVYDSG